MGTFVHVSSELVKEETVLYATSLCYTLVAIRGLWKMSDIIQHRSQFFCGMIIESQDALDKRTMTIETLLESRRQGAYD